MKRLLVPALSAGLLTVALSVPALAFQPATNAATRALQWIHTQQKADGSIGGDASNTEYTVWGLGANHLSISTFATAGKNPLDYLATNVGNEEKTAGSSAQLLLAVIAASQNPRTFAGHDLVADLEATFGAKTPGEYGDNDIFGDALAIVALKGADRNVPEAAGSFLTGHQCTDGGWHFDSTLPCGTAPDNASDTNTTAVTLIALAASGGPDEAVRTRALAYLKGQQQASGGFEFQASPPPFNVSDPDSDGLVIQGLLAVGQDPTAAQWSVGTKNALTDLLSFQGCDGSFSFPGVGPDNLLATTQPLSALASTHLPIHPGTQSSTDVLSLRPVAPANCSSPATTASPTPHPSAGRLAQTGAAADPRALIVGLAIFLAGLGILRRQTRRASSP
jgi:hypothetical protein